VPEYLSITEAEHEDDVHVPSLLAYAKRRPDKMPLWIKPAGDGWAAKQISRVVTSRPCDPELWSYSEAEVWVKEAVRVRPETVVGAEGRVVFQRFRLDGLHPEHGGEVRDYFEFPEPRTYAAMDLLLRRSDLDRWKALTAARLDAGVHVERLRGQIRVVVERAELRWSTKRAAKALGVDGNTLLTRRRRAEELDLPSVWRVMNPEVKRVTYRWVDDAEALRDWSALLDLSTGRQPGKPKRRPGGGGKPGARSERVIGDEIDRLLG